MNDAERQQAIRDWHAGADQLEARRGGYEHTYRLANGQTAEVVARNVTVLMEAVADDEAWLLSSDPIAWRDVMVDLLHDQFDEFVILVERTVVTPNPPRSA